MFRFHVDKLDRPLSNPRNFAVATFLASTPDGRANRNEIAAATGAAAPGALLSIIWGLVDQGYVRTIEAPDTSRRSVVEITPLGREALRNHVTMMLAFVGAAGLNTQAREVA